MNLKVALLVTFEGRADSYDLRWQVAGS